MKDLSGQTVKGYQMRDRIGAGGFGVVYRAYQPAVERDVAIKVILPEYADHPDFIRRFEDEARLVARLEHMNIVPLYDFWREPGSAYLVMRLLSRSLRDQLEEGLLPVPSVARLVEQIAAALTIAHTRGVIHRDIKPGNVLLDDDGNGYLTDFGLATALTSQVEVDEGITGTPSYLAPEQFKGCPPSPSTDLYALGIMIYELLTGQHPFAQAQNVTDMMMMHLHDPVPLLDELPPTLDTVIQCATAKDPAERYPDVLHLAMAFRAAASESQAGTPDAHPTTSVAWTPVEIVLTPRNPYKGLRAFEAADAEDFFGRETLVQALVERLCQEHELRHFLAVVGPSGSGKSSVVKAGLLPALRAGAVPGSEEWYITEMVPGARPLEDLALALTGVATTAGLDLEPLLRADARGLLGAVEQALPGAHLLLVIDQFEEIFTQADDPTQFLRLLYTAVTEPNPPLHLVITLRADFYDRPLMHPYFSELVSQRTHVVVPLTAEEVERAITIPAEKVGLTVEPGLVAAMVTEVVDQPGMLPMLQYCLTELFDRRTEQRLTLEAYQEIGGVLGALARRAEETYCALEPGPQAATRQMFMRLVTLGEGAEDTRRRMLLNEVLSLQDAAATMQTAIDAFDRSRLLTFDRDPTTRAPTVEVAHEALLREWGRLRDWLDASRHDIRQQRRLAAAAGEWARAGHDNSYLMRGTHLIQFEAWAADTTVALSTEERTFLDASLTLRAQQQARQRLWRRAVTAITLVALAVMGVLALFALEGQRVAEEQRDEARSAYATSDALAMVAEQNARSLQALYLAGEAQQALARGDTDLALALALEAYRLDADEVRVQRSLVDVAEAGGTQQRLVGSSGALTRLAVSPDGTRAIVIDRDGHAILWDLERGALLYDRVFDTDEGLSDVAFSPSGAMAALIGITDGEGFVAMWDVEDPATAPQRLAYDPAQWPLEVAFHQHLVVSSETRITIIDPTSGETVQVYATLSRPRGLAVSPQGYVLFGQRNALYIWDPVSNTVLQRVPGHDDLIRDIAIHPPWVLSTTREQTILWELSEDCGEITELYRLQGGPASMVDFSPDGRLFVGRLRTSGEWRLLTALDVRETATGQRVAHLQGTITEIADVQFAPNSTPQRPVLLSVSGDELRDTDNSLRQWILSGLQATFAGPAVMNPTHDTALVGLQAGWFNDPEASQRERVQLVDVATHDVVQELSLTQPGIPLAAAFSPDGRLVAVSAIDIAQQAVTIVVFDVSEGARLNEYALPPYSLHNRLDFSPLGMALVAGEIPNRTPTSPPHVHVWRADSGSPLHLLEAHNATMRAVFSPDGTRLLTVGMDERAVVWDLATGAALTEFTGHAEPLIEAVFMPDGRHAITSDESGLALRWDTVSGEIVQRYRVGTISDVSPDGRLGLAITAGEDSSASNLLDVINLETGTVVQRYADFDQLIFWAGFSADGGSIYATSYDTTHLWSTPPYAALSDMYAWLSQNRYVRDFTCDERAAYHILPLCEVDTIKS